jgi:hypothetical protein
MTMAAIANDTVDFREAYRLALIEAKKEGKPDPQKAVAESFADSLPLRTVFRLAPTQSQFARLLAAMDDSGRDAVRVAITRLNGYGEQIGAKPFTGKADASATIRPQMDLNDIRKRAMGSGGAIPTLNDARRAAASSGYDLN